MHGSDQRQTPHTPHDRSVSIGDLPSLRDARGEAENPPVPVSGGPTSENPPPPPIAGLPEGLPVAPPTVIELSQQSAAAAQAAGSAAHGTPPPAPATTPAPMPTGTASPMPHGTPTPTPAPAPVPAPELAPPAPISHPAVELAPPADPAMSVGDARSEPIVIPSPTMAEPPLRTRATLEWDAAHATEPLGRMDAPDRAGATAHPSPSPVPAPTEFAPAPHIPSAPVAPATPIAAPINTELPINPPPINTPAIAAPVTNTPVIPDPAIAAETPSIAPPAAASIAAAAAAPRTPESIAPPAQPSVDPDVMQDLLDQADRMMVQLQTGIEEARSTHAEPASLAHRLQERLRVGAKMLKAFQAQIDRAETVVTEAADRSRVAETLETHLDDATRCIAEATREEADRVKRELATAIDAAREAIDERARRRERPEVEVRQIVETVDAHVTGKIGEVDAYFDARTPTLPTQETLDLRVEQALAAAMERFDRHAAQRRAELDAQTAAFDQVQARVAAFAERLEATESRNESVQTRAEESARTIRGELEEAHGMARQCLDARNGLAAELRKAVAGSDELAARGERIRLDVDEQVTRYDRLQSHVSSSMGTIEEAVRRIDHAERIVGRLERLSERLAPWEGLLTSGPQTADGLPKSAVDLVEHLQSGLGRDIESISSTMRDMAERMGGLAPRRSIATTAEPRPGGMDRPADASAASAAISAIDGEVRTAPMSIDEARAESDAARRSA